MILEILVLAGDRHKIVTGLNSLMGSQPFPLENWISTAIIYKKTIEKHARRRFHSKRLYTTTQMTVQ